MTYSEQESKETDQRNYDISSSESEMYSFVLLRLLSAQNRGCEK